MYAFLIFAMHIIFPAHLIFLDLLIGVSTLPVRLHQTYSENPTNHHIIGGHSINLEKHSLQILLPPHPWVRSQGSSVHIVTMLRTGWLEFDSRQGQCRNLFLFATIFSLPL